ncbi:hypothetical protein GGF31_007529 [Allomyces arbusculus]|nr:hypothetical protein GGF31_007529 [Allomyces arbusculus]
MVGRVLPRSSFSLDGSASDSDYELDSPLLTWIPSLPALDDNEPEMLLDEYLAPYAPLVRVVPHPDRGDRLLVAAKDFSPGEVVFSEPALLDTAHAVAQHFAPVSGLSIAPDYQRLMYEFVVHAVYQPVPTTYAAHALLLAELSADGMTSALAERVNGERIAQYRADVKVFRDKIKKRFAKRGNKGGGSFPTTETLLKLLYIIETNVHSEDIKTGPVATSGDDNDDAEAEGEEEHCVLSIVASMPEHSCKPNALVTFFPPFSPAPDSAQTIGVSDIELAKAEPVTHLLFTALQPIAAGDVISIAYQENSFLPTRVRRGNLANRGFVCNCRMCAGPDPDFARAFVCANPMCRALVSPVGSPRDQGSYVPPPPPPDTENEDEEMDYDDDDQSGDDEDLDAQLVCGRCGEVVSTMGEIIAAEARLAHDPEAMLAVLSPVLDVFSRNVPATDTFSARTLASILLGDCLDHPDLTAALTDPDSGVHVSPSHFLVYDALKQLLFFDADAIDRVMHVPALMYLVAVNYVALAPAPRPLALASLHVAPSDESDAEGGDVPASDAEWTRLIAWNGDVQHNLLWLMKQARARGNLELAQWASDRGLDTCAAMGVAASASGAASEFGDVFSRPRSLLAG